MEQQQSDEQQDMDKVAGNTTQPSSSSSLDEASTGVVEIPFQLPSRLFQQHHDPNQILLQCIDCHAGGEPARVVVAGVLCLPPSCITAYQKRCYMMEHCDHLRQVLLLEPRGYPCQNANFLFPMSGGNDTNGNDAAPLFQYVIAEQNKIYPMMSGHNTICVATALVECGMIPTMPDSSSSTIQFSLEAPAGPIAITATLQPQEQPDEEQPNSRKVHSISFQNAPSFVEALDVTIDVPHVGPVTVDIAYGGMWYVICDLQQPEPKGGKTPLSQLRLDPVYGKELCRIGEMIKVACREQHPVQHPTIDYPGCDILVFRDSRHHRDDNDDHPQHNHVRARNAVIMSNTVLDWDKPETWTAMMDRSPCGTGTCAVMALLHAKGMLKVGDTLEHSSIIGSTFQGRIIKEVVMEDGRVAILPEITGSAYITQYSQVVVDPEDPFPQGFRVADIW